MTATLEMVEMELAAAETEMSPETLAAEVVATAYRLQDGLDPLHVGFREKVGVEVTPLQEANAVPVGGHRLLLKNETVHPGNAYKLRGMSSAILTGLELKPWVRRVHVASAGNAALGVAEASNMLGLESTAHMKDTASLLKQHELTNRGTAVENRYASLPDAMVGADAAAAADEYSMVVHPYNQVEVMAGQATIMQESLQQLEDAGYDLRHDTVDIIVAGGGLGLAAGAASWLAHQKELGKVGPGIRLTVAEVVRYTENGKLDKSQLPWCDGTATTDGDQTRAILDLYADQVGFIEVTETEVAQAMHELSAALHKRVEPAGALATAASKKLAAQHPRSWLDENGEMQYDPARTYVSVVSGANVSDDTWAQAAELRQQAYENIMSSLAAMVTNTSVTTVYGNGHSPRSTKVASGK